MSGIKHFRSRLEGRPFQLWTDHKPLIFALHRVSPPTSGRQQRHLAFISEYTNQLKYLPGTFNVVADALSRPASAAGVEWVCAAIADKSPLDLKDMALRQILCPQVQALRSSPGLFIITRKVGDLDLIGDSSTGTLRPLVPRDLQRQVFEHLHGAAHPGSRATRRLISSRYVWKGLSTDVTAWAKACLGCQQAKVHPHVQVPPQHIPVPSRRFSHIHVDLVGPLPASKGFTYLFTIIDRTSRWPEAIPIAATTTVDCANALFQGTGEPLWSPGSYNIRQRGPVHLLPVGRPLQPAQHPAQPDHRLPLAIQRDGRTLPPPSEGCPPGPLCHGELGRPPHLPWVLLGLRAVAREDDGSTPAQEVFGTPLILPGQFLDSPEMPPKIFLEQFSKTLSAAEHSATRHNTTAAHRPPPQLPDNLARAPTVFVRRDGHVPPLYDGPYTVNRCSLHHFTLRIGNKVDKVSTLRLKPCTDPTAPPALPRVQGRPAAAVRFRGFPPPGAAAAHRVHFAPEQPAEPRQENKCVDCYCHVRLPRPHVLYCM